MKKFYLLILSVAVVLSNANAQDGKDKKNKNESDSLIGLEYVPIEGRSEDGVPKNLQGTWVLSSGLSKAAPNTKALNKRPAAGTDIRKDSVTYTTTVNGETRTTTEVNIERMGTSEKQITPPQKDNMHQPAKPSISFYGLNETFSGFTGCNKYSGRYKLSGNKLLLLDGAASTRMVCMGEYNEAEFLSILKKINMYKVANNQLKLTDGDNVLLVFSRN